MATNSFWNCCSANLVQPLYNKLYFLSQSDCFIIYRFIVQIFKSQEYDDLQNNCPILPELGIFVFFYAWKGSVNIFRETSCRKHRRKTTVRKEKVREIVLHFVVSSSMCLVPYSRCALLSHSIHNRNHSLYFI